MKYILLLLVIGITELNAAKISAGINRRLADPIHHFFDCSRAGIRVTNILAGRIRQEHKEIPGSIPDGFPMGFPPRNIYLRRTIL